MKKMTRFFALSFIIASFAIVVSAQSYRATLVGRVTDPGGANVAGANVTVTQNGTNFTRNTTTNNSGEYAVSELQPGSYSVKIDAPGFKSAINQDVVLETDQTRRFDVGLDVGSVNESVTVEAEPPTINTETPEKGEVIVQRQVQELPLNVRDFTDLAKLVPGIYQRPSEDDQGQGLGSAGTRTDSTNFILDGVSNRNDRNGGVGVNTSVDSIQEFKVSTSTYSAEYGRLAGAQISVVSKSGTNRYSGSLFEFVRNDFFDATNALSDPLDNKVLRRHQFGGTFGGPLPFLAFGESNKLFESGKDKTFFFASFEQLREVRSVFSDSEAPNEAWYSGNFSAIRGSGTNTGVCVPGSAVNTTASNPCNDDTNRVTCLSRSSSGVITKVECPVLNVIPLTVNPAFPNILPANSAIAQRILQYLPRANGPNGSQDYKFSVLTNILPRNLFSAKIDRKLTDDNSFYFRFSLDNRDAYQPQAGRINYPGFLRNQKYRQNSYAFGDTHSFTPTLINDFRIGLLDTDNRILNENNDQDFVSILGLTGLPTASQPSLWGFPAIRIDGFPDTGDSANIPFNYLYKNLSISDSLTWIVGNHNFKFGIDVVRPNYIESDIRNVRGDFRFRGRYSNPLNATVSGANAFADLLYGLPDSTQRQIGSEPADLIAWQSAFYVQDNWRVTPWLTFNLGLRYDYTPYLYEKTNRISNFIPQLGVTACAGGEFRENGTLICVDGASLGLPRALVNTDNNNLAPRVGFALKPFNDDKTVIRGGAGIFYSTETINPARQQLANNYPYLNRQSFNRASTATANYFTLTLDNPFPADRTNLQGVTTPQGIPTDAQTPELYQFNLTLERELLPDLGFEIGYVGSLGRYLGMRYNLNFNYPTGVLGADGRPINARRFPALGDITYQSQEVNSSYHAMQVAVRRRSKNGLTLLASYTFGKAMDQNSNTNNSTTASQRGPQDIYDFRNEWALADYHRTHQFSASFNYDLPFGKGRKFFSGANGITQVLLGGWQLNGIATALSGRPFTPAYNAPDTSGGRPNLVGDPMANVPAGRYFNPAAFTRPTSTADNPDLFGNAGRNIVIGPGFQSVDLSLFKNFRLAEKTKLQLRWEVFNALNRPNFQVPQHILDASDAAQFRLTANEGREMQFAVRLTF
ncbi:MAG: TonB-dependent receptor [Acidobacteria bacterium]|nr:TonB-dependent receptor [Acidobacteriota bacterium]